MTRIKLHVKYKIIVNKNILNSDKLSSPIHLPTQGQWWSYPLTHISQSIQWTVPFDFSNLHATQAS